MREAPQRGRNGARATSDRALRHHRSAEHHQTQRQLGAPLVVMLDFRNASQPNRTLAGASSIADHTMTAATPRGQMGRFISGAGGDDPLKNGRRQKSGSAEPRFSPK